MSTDQIPMPAAAEEALRAAEAGWIAAWLRDRAARQVVSHG